MGGLIQLQDSIFSKDNVILLEINKESYLASLEALLVHLVNKKKMPCVFVTVNRPYGVLKKLFEKNNIDQGLIVVIEAVPANMGSKSVPTNSNCLSLDGPYSLTDISLAVSQALSSIPHKDKFVIIDSLDAFLRYGSDSTILRFMHFIMDRIRNAGAKGIILTVKQQKSRDVVVDLSEICQYESITNFVRAKSWLS